MKSNHGNHLSPVFFLFFFVFVFFKGGGGGGGEGKPRWTTNNILNGVTSLPSNCQLLCGVLTSRPCQHGCALETGTSLSSLYSFSDHFTTPRQNNNTKTVQAKGSLCPGCKSDMYNCYFQEIAFSLLRQMLFQKVSVSRLSYGSVIRKFYIFN